MHASVRCTALPLLKKLSPLLDPTSDGLSVSDEDADIVTGFGLTSEGSGLSLEFNTEGPQSLDLL